MREKPILLESDAVRSIVAGLKTEHRVPVSKYMTITHVDDIGYYIDGVTDSFGRVFRYPYGCPGDRIWVREPFRVKHIQYKADGDSQAPVYAVGGWQPSMYMPRWASRLTMDVLAVWIEPLQSITDEGAMHEGSDLFEYPGVWNRAHKETEFSWAANPFVFVTRFSVI